MKLEKAVKTLMSEHLLNSAGYFEHLDGDVVGQIRGEELPITLADETRRDPCGPRVEITGYQAKEGFGLIKLYKEFTQARPCSQSRYKMNLLYLIGKQGEVVKVEHRSVDAQYHEDKKPEKIENEKLKNLKGNAGVRVDYDVEGVSFNRDYKYSLTQA